MNVNPENHFSSKKLLLSFEFEFPAIPCETESMGIAVIKSLVIFTPGDLKEGSGTFDPQFYSLTGRLKIHHWIHLVAVIFSTSLVKSI